MEGKKEERDYEARYRREIAAGDDGRLYKSHGREECTTLAHSYPVVSAVRRGGRRYIRLQGRRRRRRRNEAVALKEEGISGLAGGEGGRKRRCQAGNNPI